MDSSLLPAFPTITAHGFYTRTLSDTAFDGVIRVRRYLCNACRRTVSLLPEFMRRNQAKKQHPILICDEAHLLQHPALEQLPLLLNLDMDSARYLTLLCGAGTTGQMEDNVRTARTFKPLTAGELADVRKRAIVGQGVYTGPTMEYWKMKA